MKRYDDFAHFIRALKRYDDQTALGIKRTFRVEETSYNQLQRNVYQTAHWLQHEGLKKQDHVIIVAPNMPEWGQLFLACQLIGVVVVPVDVRSSLGAVDNIASKAKPKLIFRGQHFLKELDKNHKTTVLEDLPELIQSAPTDEPKHSPKGSDQALLVFTSGTTGEPKGVVLTQRNLLANVQSISRALAILPRWRFLSILPLSHTYELTVGFLTVINGGASVYYVARIAPLAIARGLRDHQITSLLAVPQILYLFKKTIQSKAADQGKAGFLRAAQKLTAGMPIPMRRILFKKIIKELGGLEFVATGSAPVDVEAVYFWERLGVQVLQGYGLTETAPVLTMNTFKERSVTSQGKAVPGVNLRIGQGSEIQAKGNNVFPGYWKNNEQTNQSFTDDGWFKTGDIGEIDKKGWLYIRGREKFVIVLASGLKVFPEDVELIASKHPQFKEICIVGIEQKEGEAVHAVIIAGESDKKVDDAINDINAHLESHQKIDGWTRWETDDFPRTRLLKVDRKKVWEWANKKAAGTKASAKDYLEPSKDKLSDLIRIALSKSDIKINDGSKLADLGLDSLGRLTLVSLIEEQMSVSIAEHIINQNTTVGELRKLIKKGTFVEEVAKRPKWTYWQPVRFLGMLVREAILFPLVRIYVKTKVVGRENLQSTNQPAIFIFNHLDSLDAFVVYRSLPFNIRQNLAAATARDVMKKHVSISFFGRLCFAAFDFARKEPFIPSLDYMARLIDKNWNIAIAPEGKVSEDGKQQPFKSGTGMMAVEMQVPVIPIKTKGLYGTMPLHSRWPRKRSRVTVHIGKPIVFNKRTSYQDATKQLEQIMREL